MKKLVDIKKGDTVCIIDGSRNEDRFVCETIVETCGSKYITTSHTGRGNKFSKQSLHSDFMGYRLFKGNKEECLKHIEEKKEKKKMIKEISHYLDWCDPDYEFVKRIYNEMKEITEE